MVSAGMLFALFARGNGLLTIAQQEDRRSKVSPTIGTAHSHWFFCSPAQGAPIDLEMGSQPAAAGIYKIINESASAANS